MYFDGAVNATGSGIGAILISLNGQYYPAATKVVQMPRNKIVGVVREAAIDYLLEDGCTVIVLDIWVGEPTNTC